MSRTATTPLLLDGHWSHESGGEGHVVFEAEGIHCAQCARAIRQALETTAGVRRVDINVVTRRVSLSWDTARVSLAALLQRVAQTGFRPVPLVGEAAAHAQRLERRLALKRIGLAALGSMQVMMYAGGLYAGAFQGIDATLATVLRWACLVIALPVLLYSGAPILRGALADLRRRVLGMDVTVSLALVLAFLASAFNTIRGQGDVYFDSVTMFILFLLLGRFVEMRGRHQASQVTDALAKALPSVVQRLRPGSTDVERIPLADVQVGDELRVASQQIIPVDGELTCDRALVDESLVTGESTAATRHRGALMMGGALNAGPALTVRVTRRPADSTLHGLVRLLERAQSERPRLGVAAERMASWFVIRVLMLTGIVTILWWIVDPARAFPAALAVLVATCPCALSIATPVAIASATSQLAKLGILVLRADAVEGLATVDTLLLDKTGTLTSGLTTVTATRSDESVGEPLDETYALRVAAALEHGSAHPLAAAFAPHRVREVSCSDAEERAGDGIEGTIDGVRWRLGRASFACPSRGTDEVSHLTGIWLSDEQGRHACFDITDPLRPEAAPTIGALQRAGLTVELVSGDRTDAVERARRALGIDTARAEQRPQDKLGHLRALQSQGHRVLMVGDGINDGPVLAAANVSMAMGRGSPIAHAAGDLLLLRESLDSLPRAIALARRTLTIVRQNLRWAAAYNLLAIPIAALGWMPPWVAAIGMSLSSLVVVFNARRLARSPSSAEVF